jgi:hypothetical protein
MFPPALARKLVHSSILFRGPSDVVMATNAIEC